MMLSLLVFSLVAVDGDKVPADWRQKAIAAHTARLNALRTSRFSPDIYVLDIVGKNEGDRRMISSVDVVIAGESYRQKTFHFEPDWPERQRAEQYDTKLNTMIRHKGVDYFINEHRFDVVQTKPKTVPEANFQLNSYLDRLFLRPGLVDKALDRPVVFSLADNRVASVLHRDLWLPDCLSAQDWEAQLVDARDCPDPPVGWYVQGPLLKITRVAKPSPVRDTLYFYPALDYVLVCRLLDLDSTTRWNLYACDFEQYPAYGWLAKYIIWGMRGSRLGAEELTSLSNNVDQKAFEYEFEPGTTIRDVERNTVRTLPGGEHLLISTVDSFLMQNGLLVVSGQPKPMWRYPWWEKLGYLLLGMATAFAVWKLFHFLARLMFPQRSGSKGITNASSVDPLPTPIP